MPGLRAWIVRLTALAALLIAAGPAFAENRLALVIGNSAYNSNALANPVNDAKLMSATLSKLGFIVTTVLDADQKTMKRAMIDFSHKLREQDGVGLFYYAGHGVQVQGENYLVPIDAKIDNENDVPIETIAANEFLRTMESTKSRVNIIILDACRNDPFAHGTRALSRGLAIVQAPSGSIVAYSTSPGEVALDGVGANSPYAVSLAKAMQMKGVKIEDVFKITRNGVADLTQKKQKPWENTSLSGDFYFVEGAPDAGGSTVNSPPDPRLADLQAYDDVKDSTDVAALEAFIAAHPDSNFADVVKGKLARLNGTSAPAGDQVAILEPPPADPNSPEGLFRRGRDLEAGKSGAADIESAIGFYRQAAKQGFAPAMTRLASAYFTGEGISADPQQGIELLHSAADKGDPNAITDLARHTLKGDGTPKNSNEAVSLYRRAASLGSAEAYAELGMMFKSGNGVAKSAADAFQLLQEGAKRGSNVAMFSLAQLYEKGEGVPRDMGEAARWYKLSADRGHAPSATAIGRLFEFGSGVGKDLAGAVRSYEAATKTGDADGMTSLGYLYEQGKGVEANPQKAAELYRKAAAKGDPRAMYFLATMLHEGRGVAANDTQAAKFYVQAALAGHASAMRGLANLYEKGLGVEQNSRRAAEYLLLSYKAGHKDSRAELNTTGGAWSAATLREVQAVLKSSGYYKGKVDGKLGQPTTAALKAYLTAG